MNMMGEHRRHLLLLAGSGEAREIAAALLKQPDWTVTASLLFPERSTGPLPVPTRLGRFGGEDGMARFLTSEAVDAVLDATHPFANQITAQAVRVCGRLALPFAQVLRAAWVPGPGDRWAEVANEAAVAAILRPGQRVFTTTGRATLDQLVSRSSARFFVRQLEPRETAAPFANVRYVTGQGPFSVQEELQTLRDLKIDVLVCKNSGGDPSRTKLDAARMLGIPVILIARPVQPDVVTLETVSAALDWVHGL
jgi:precorrin-6A/cobalt-precorrin-6A reductase